MAKFMLASESPRRANLLRQMGVEFEAIKSGVDEEAVPKASPSIYVKKLARLKARAVANRYPEGIIIGADSVVVLDGRIIGKPRDAVDAKSTLQRISGATRSSASGLSYSYATRRSQTATRSLQTQ